MLIVRYEHCCNQRRLPLTAASSAAVILESTGSSSLIRGGRSCRAWISKPCGLKSASLRSWNSCNLFPRQTTATKCADLARCTGQRRREAARFRRISARMHTVAFVVGPPAINLTSGRQRRTSRFTTPPSTSARSSTCQYLGSIAGEPAVSP